LPLHKIAITISPAILARLDQWAARKHQSRSRFIAEQLERRLQELEDENVTRLYDDTYQAEGALQENRELTKDMGQIAPRDDDGNEAW
jgi:predicted DNA-binding protein